MGQLAHRILIAERTRRLLVVGFSVYHAAVMLCGPCLHELPCGAHPRELSATAADSSSGPITSLHLRPDDCPVCHLFSQSQFVSDPVGIDAVRHVRPWVPDLLVNVGTPATLRITLPRAPPRSRPAVVRATNAQGNPGRPRRIHAKSIIYHCFS